MRVEKWYLDCVTDNGAGFIGYAARLSCGPLALRCAETLQWRFGDPAARNLTVLGGHPPLASPGVITWDCARVNAKGEWRSAGEKMPTTVLHESDAGRIEWTCLSPSATVAAEAAGRHYEGLGYAERLVMTVPPSRLPLHELRWGRFLASGQSLIWIQWRDPGERRWFFHHGRPVEARMPEPDRIIWNGHRLKLGPATTLRAGRLADTVFNQSRLLRHLLPATVLQFEETKWCCPGVLTDSENRDHAGWAIHEVAKFP